MIANSYRALLVLVAVATAMGCTSPEADGVSAKMERHVFSSDKAGAFLYGWDGTCVEHTDCPCSVCHFGQCVGYLGSERIWIQDTLVQCLEDGLPMSAATMASLTAQVAALVDDEEEDDLVRGRALKLLAAVAPAEAAKRLEGCFEGSHGYLTLIAALELARTGHQGATSYLSNLLKDGPDLAGSLVLEQLARGEAAPALVPLVEAASKGDDPLIAAKAAKVLASWATPEGD